MSNTMGTSPDAELRILEREAACDPEAEEKLRAARCRNGQHCAGHENLAPGPTATRCNDMWILEDSRAWSYHATLGGHGLELRADELVHLKRGSEALDTLRWILNRYEETGELP